MEFQCKFHYGFGLGYTCRVEKVIETSPRSGVIILTGSHCLFRGNNDVKNFVVSNQPIGVYPKELSLQERFKNLTRLEMVDCGLKLISRDDFVGLENLEYLNLDKNSLTSLPEDLFVGMRKLCEIHFSFNKIVRGNSKLLQPIESSLKIAYFLSNPKTNCFYDHRTEGKEKLEWLKHSLDLLEPPLTETGTQTETAQKMVVKTDRKLESQHQQVIKKFAEFKASGQFTDFKIKVCGKEFNVHKAILAAQSPVFNQLFTNDDITAEKTFTKVKNFGKDSFDCFMDYFYTGDVDDKVDALQVFELAVVFDVAMLTDICTDRILASLSDENALEVFNLAHHHHADHLKREAFKIIQVAHPEVSDTLINNPDVITKLVEAKCEISNILFASKMVEMSK